jgi:tetratricopeptide (TPR) repeat protein
MYWKEQLRKLEKAQQWDFAIDFMKEVIEKNPNDMDAYMAMNFLIMNLLVEEDFEHSKHDYYAQTLKKYFDESYARFSHSAEYLYYTGAIAHMSVWYFGIETEDARAMLDESMRLEPDNILYQSTYYNRLDLNNPENKMKALERAKMILEENSPIKKMLHAKESMGAHLFGLMVVGSYELIHGSFITDEAYAHYMQGM